MPLKGLLRAFEGKISKGVLTCTCICTFTCKGALESHNTEYSNLSPVKPEFTCTYTSQMQEGRLKNSTFQLEGVVLIQRSDTTVTKTS